jgi:nitroreductase
MSHYIYWAYRYIRYSGLSNNYQNSNVNFYTLIRTIHSLEKSFLFEPYDKNRAKKNIIFLQKLVKHSSDQFIIKYVQHVIDNYNKNNFYNTDRFKTNISLQDQKIIQNFLKSRKSTRFFLRKKVSDKIINKIIQMSLYAPSTCNRQMWKTHIIQNNKQIKKILSLQNGNAGFTNEINNLLIVCVDTYSYSSYKEINQIFIDGGIYLNYLTTIMNSFNISNCLLNWSTDIKSDLMIRKHSNINDSETIIALLAFGYEGKVKYCDSKRKLLPN